MILTNLGIFGNIISNGPMIIIDNIGPNLLTMARRYSALPLSFRRDPYILVGQIFMALQPSVFGVWM